MKLDKVINYVTFYSQNYRGNLLDKLIISEKYPLFPKVNSVSKYNWPDKWEHCGNSGVYLFIDDNDEVIYIGETVHFGNRFGAYFGTNALKECVLKHTWIENPKYVISIKVPDNSSFERLGLEEYLIINCKPIDNKKFNR